MTRTEEVLWIPEYLEDLDADFRVFYRIDGVGDGQFGGLSSARFVQLAERLFAYRGAMRARVEMEVAEQGPQPAGAAAGRPEAAPAEEYGVSPAGRPGRVGRRVPPPAGSGQVRVVEGDRSELMRDPAMSSVIDFG